MAKIKICGLSRAADIAAVNRTMPDYAGFVFAESRRAVSAEAARGLKAMLDPAIKAVGVFANEPIINVARLYADGVIGVVQLHGGEGSEYISELKRLCGCPVIRAVPVGDSPPVVGPSDADYILFDSAQKFRGMAGGAFDWGLLSGCGSAPFFLAGGLTSVNVIDAIRKTDPYCVDVSGGVETDGAKDARKIQKFIETVRGNGL